MVGETVGGGAEGEEVEWQFDALDLRPVERWLAALPSRVYGDGVPTLTVLAKQPRRLVDHYADTADWRVARAGFVLRTRQRGRATEATMKDMRPATAGGLRQRLEVTQPLAGGVLAGLGTDGPVGRRVSAVAGSRPLVEMLEVRTRRTPFSLRSAGVEVAEVALDETSILVAPGEPPARLRRVEVEVTAGWADRLAGVVDHLRDSCGLRPATMSKFEAGLLAAGVSVPGPPDLGPTDVAPDATLGELAAAILRRQLRELLAHEPGTRLGEDIEELHDMRVATRRLRAAIELFGAALPVRAQSLRRELGWLADSLGTVRDLDVQLARMEQMTAWTSGWSGADHGVALAPLKSLLDAERADAQRALLAALDSARWDRLAAGLLALARQDGNRRLPAARTPAAIALPALIRERHDAIVRAARRARRSGIPADYHRLRIRGKRLRYALEFTADIYAGGASKFVKKLTRVQEQLGSMQDAEVASTRLFTLATTEDERIGALPQRTVFLMGGIAEKYRRESDDLRHSAAKLLDDLDAKAWKRLDSLMSRREKDAEAAVERVPRRQVRGAPLASPSEPEVSPELPAPDVPTEPADAGANGAGAAAGSAAAGAATAMAGEVQSVADDGTAGDAAVRDDLGLQPDGVRALDAPTTGTAHDRAATGAPSSNGPAHADHARLHADHEDGPTER